MMKNMVKQNQKAMSALQNQNRFIVQHVENVSKLIYHLTKTKPPSSLSSEAYPSRTAGFNSNVSDLQLSGVSKNFSKSGNQTNTSMNRFQNDPLDFQDQIDRYYKNHNIFQEDQNLVKVEHYDKKNLDKYSLKNKLDSRNNIESLQSKKKQIKLIKREHKPHKDYRLYPSFPNPYSIYLGSIRYQRQAFLVEQGYVLDFLNKYLKQNVIATPDNPSNCLGKKQIMELYQKWKQLYKYKSSQQIKQPYIQAILTNQIKGMFECLCGKTGFIGLSFKVDDQELKTINSVYNELQNLKENQKNGQIQTNPNKGNQKNIEQSQRVSQKQQYVQYQHYNQQKDQTIYL